MKVYHYARLDQFPKINQGVVDRQGHQHEPGLPALSPVVWQIPEAKSSKALFGLLEPAPDSWVNNEAFPAAFPFLMQCTGDLMLEIAVTPKTEGAYVLEQAHMRNQCPPGKTHPDLGTYPSQFYHTTNQEAETAYIASKVPLQTYLEHPEQFSYSLPEVIFVNDVPLENVNVSDQQPKLEQKLARLTADSPERLALIDSIAKTPGLETWWKQYTTGDRHGQDSDLQHL